MHTDNTTIHLKYGDIDPEVGFDVDYVYFPGTPIQLVSGCGERLNCAPPESASVEIQSVCIQDASGVENDLFHFLDDWVITALQEKILEERNG